MNERIPKKIIYSSQPGDSSGEFSDFSNEKGFSSFELIIVIAVVCVFFVGGIIVVKIINKSAYDITAKHDLKLFADFQQYYFVLNNRCLGEQGQSVRNDGVTSDLPVDNYTVSEGVCITIVSGDPENPNDLDNTFKIQAKHEKSDVVFEYNFQSDKITER